MKIVCLPANVGLDRDSEDVFDRDEIPADGPLAMMMRARSDTRTCASAGDIFAE